MIIISVGSSTTATFRIEFHLPVYYQHHIFSVILDSYGQKSVYLHTVVVVEQVAVREADTHI